MLATLKAELGDLRRVRRIVKLLAEVNLHYGMAVEVEAIVWSTADRYPRTTSVLSLPADCERPQDGRATITGMWTA
jgi:hypothetical protein